MPITHCITCIVVESLLRYYVSLYTSDSQLSYNKILNCPVNRLGPPLSIEIKRIVVVLSRAHYIVAGLLYTSFFLKQECLYTRITAIIINFLILNY